MHESTFTYLLTLKTQENNGSQKNLSNVAVAYRL